MSSMNKVAKELKKAMTESDERKPKAYDTEATVARVDGDTLWVKIPGGETETPVRRTIDAKKGDKVMVRIANHRAWTAGNETNPPTDDTTARKAQNTAKSAQQEAQSAHQAADTAWMYADSAHEAAETAWAHAEDAYNAAYAANVAADIANGAATQAQTDADTARTMANRAIDDASAASQAAQTAQLAADDALADAAEANDQAIKAGEAAANAQSSADAAATSASTADQKADQAIEAATQANVAASGAVESLSIVEDVLGTLKWVSEHAEYVLTEDEEVVPSKYYFVALPQREGGTVYSPVTPEEGANPKALGYYEISSIKEAVSNYVATHLALGDNGLYIQTSTEEKTSRVLVSPTDGVVLYGPLGEVVAKYGTNTIIGNEEDTHIRISDEKVSFCEGNTEVAYISGEKLYITQSVVTDNMMVGENKWIWKFDPRDDSIFLKWIG